MKIIKVTLISMVILSFCFGESLKDEIEKQYMNKSVKWEKSLNDASFISTAKKSKDFVLTQIFDLNTVLIEYFNSDGELIWSIDETNQDMIDNIKAVDIKLSDNGDVVMIKWLGIYEESYIQIYDRSGRLIYNPKKDLFGIALKRIGMSPNGYYIDLGYPLINKFGEKVELNLPVATDYKTTFDIKFINDQYIVIQLIKHVRKMKNISYEEYKNIKVSYDGETLTWILYDLTNHSTISVNTVQKTSYKNLLIIPLEKYFLIWNPSNNITYFYKETGELLWKKKECPVLDNYRLLRDGKYFFDLEKMYLYKIKGNTLYGYQMNDGSKVYENTIEGQKDRYLGEFSIYIDDNIFYLNQSRLKTSQKKYIVIDKLVTKIWKLNTEKANSDFSNDIIYYIPKKLVKKDGKLHFYK